MMFRSFGFPEFLLLLTGLKWTIGLTVMAFCGSAIAGMLLLILRISTWRIVRLAAMLWVQMVQGIPLLGHLFVVFFGLALFGWDVSRWVAAGVALSIYGSAFLADIWRGAMEGVPKGQWEGSAALGLPKWLQLRLVILPQALAIAIPPTVGFLVQLVKNTSLASVIGVVELTREAQLVNGATFAPFKVYACTSVLYFLLCLPLTSWSRRLERRRAVARA